MDNLQNLIKNDFDDNDTKRVERTMREFGIKTKIPQKVIKTAIIHSKLYSISFLQKIMEYLVNKINQVLKKNKYA